MRNRQLFFILGGLILLLAGLFFFWQNGGVKTAGSRVSLDESLTISPTPSPDVSVSVVPTPTPTASPAAEKPAPTGVKMKTYDQPPKMQLVPGANYQATVKTSAGEFTVDLAAKDTPVTVNNFVFLAREGFYNGTIFHRVIKGFMIQGGDPSGNGTGGPGYKFADEPFSGSYRRGTVAMANSGPNTNGSQFFVMHADVPLPKNYVIFGQVSAGLETIDKIATAPTSTNPATGENSVPVNPVQVTEISIRQY